MKKIITTGITILALTSTMFAGSYYWVNGYTKSDGTYVSGHTKTTPDPYKYNKNGQWLKNNHLKNCIILTVDKN